jgi:outer membrane lipoprotein-sorting protein
MNALRRLPLYRLLLLCGVVVAAGISITALALALGSGSTPPPKPLAEAVHDAIDGPAVSGFSAEVKLTNNLLEGASLAGGAGQGGGLASSPLISGASGRIWVAADGRTRLELQAEKGDTQIIYDGHTLEMYDAASNTLYRYTPPARPAESGFARVAPSTPGAQAKAKLPTVAKIEEGISQLRKHANLSGATPTDVGGQAAYTVRISPKEGGSLIGGAELSFDASNGTPLRAAIYSSTSSSPVIELASSNVSYGSVANSVFAFTPPPGAKVVEVSSSSISGADAHTKHSTDKPKLTTRGKGITAISVLQSKAGKSTGKSSNDPLAGLPKVSINGTSASELRTELGTLLSFERSGVRYLLVGAVPPAAIEALARGL